MVSVGIESTYRVDCDARVERASRHVTAEGVEGQRGDGHKVRGHEPLVVLDHAELCSVQTVDADILVHGCATATTTNNLYSYNC